MTEDDNTLRALSAFGETFGLGTLFQKPQVKDVWYNYKKVTLDGYKFISCRFDYCELHISSANFEFENCFIDQNSTIYYKGEIIKLIKLFTSRYEWFYQNLPGLVPVRNLNGTITIS